MGVRLVPFWFLVSVWQKQEISQSTYKVYFSSPSPFLSSPLHLYLLSFPLLSTLFLFLVDFLNIIFLLVAVLLHWNKTIPSFHSLLLKNTYNWNKYILLAKSDSHLGLPFASRGDFLETIPNKSLLRFLDYIGKEGEADPMISSLFLFFVCFFSNNTIGVKTQLLIIENV